MKRKKYRKILKHLRKRVFRATIEAQDDAEPHLEEVTVIQWSDIVDILWKNLREEGKMNMGNDNTVQAPAWIYEGAYFRDEEEMFKKIEKALGFRLFTWQKTRILLGVERRTGRTTAECLRALLMPDGKPIDFSYGPSTDKERVYRDTLLELKEKLDEAGIPTNPIARTKDEYNCLLRRWNKKIELLSEHSKSSICPNSLWKQ